MTNEFNSEEKIEKTPSLEELKERYPELFGKVPHDLIVFAFSENVLTTIAAICFKHGVRENKKVSRISYLVGYVLFGETKPENFQSSLVNTLNLPPETAEKIATDVDEVIFAEVKKSLDQLYPKEKVSPKTKIQKTPPENEKQTKKKQDGYRETTE